MTRSRDGTGDHDGIDGIDGIGDCDGINRNADRDSTADRDGIDDRDGGTGHDSIGDRDSTAADDAAPRGGDALGGRDASHATADATPRELLAVAVLFAVLGGALVRVATVDAPATALWTALATIVIAAGAVLFGGDAVRAALGGGGR
ncbi:hypothetical protein Hbl1158_12815 [Halobaculum sp. CBA1158]|uniref:hypothetical protein n=1 Tax=Halobaculum sp. CBA1158 TaxID=2904243 RepID=UPI001F23D886|nr:hypothetical protein [Halobaculum sp. CBA1158]UIO99399.1 hypothetical protein Hbl1158_12815 [Halobaculum sp. CBA1158]